MERVAAGGSLEALINQFSDPYTFLREMAQNAIDAQLAVGNHQPIEIATEYTPPHYAGDEGMFILKITDKGVGMSVEDIDNYFTCLFSSNKEDDEGSIGTFGIGFVSVFAFNPGAVLVDTGRGGESVRLVFKADRRFDRIRLNHDVVGTEIQVVKQMSCSAVDGVRKRIRETLVHWCRMGSLEIKVDGESINEEFRLPGALTWFSQNIDGVARLAVGPATEDSPSYELFKKGFLVETGTDDAMSLPGLAFRADSTEIGHGLTRDRVARNRAFDFLIRRVQKAVDGPYLSYVVEQAAIEPQEAAWSIVAPRLHLVSRSQLQLPLVPASDGTKLSLLELAAQVRKSEIYWTSRPTAGRAFPLWDGVSPGLGQLLSKINRVSKSRVGQLVNRIRKLPDIVLVEV